MNEIVLMTLRATITVSLFALFLVLIVWAWSPKRRQQFSEAANLVFDDTDPAAEQRATAQQEKR